MQKSKVQSKTGPGGEGVKRVRFLGDIVGFYEGSIKGTGKVRK